MRQVVPQERWGTPKGLFQILHEEFDFTLDVCADAELAKCPRYFDLDANGLTEPWAPDRFWMNPPYANIEPWTKKAVQEVRGGAPVGAALLPVRTDLAWFHRDVLAAGAEVRFIKGRLKMGDGIPNAPMPQMIVVWRPTDREWAADVQREVT